MRSTDHRTLRIFLVTAAALLAAACGGGGGGSHDGHDSAGAAPSASTISPSDMTDQQQPPSRLTIDVAIAGGNVTPTNAQLQGKVGEPIVLNVTSDVADELHVHSVPDHTFTVEAKPNQRFQFTVDVPGNVEIELHELNRVVASVQVQQ